MTITNQWKCRGVRVTCLSLCLLVPILAQATLTVTIDEPSANIVYDENGAAFVVFGEDPADFSFNCSVKKSAGGTFHYSWDFGSGDPSLTDDSTDSSAGPINFSSGATATVNVSDQLDDGTVCDSGSDFITVSHVAFDFTVVDTQYNVSNYITDDATVDSNGAYETRSDVVITTDPAILNAYLGSMGCDITDVRFVDSNNNDVTNAETDGSGQIQVTLVTRNNTDDMSVEIQ